MFYYNDPLSGNDVEVTDVSTAFYALKLANDNHYSIHYQAVEKQKELSRTATETFNQKYALLEPYLPQDSDTSYNPSLAGDKPKVIPNPLPANVPQKVIDAMNYLDEQYSLEEQRLNAELAENTAEIKETIAKLESKVAEWFKSEVQRNADWIGTNLKVVLSGCTLRYVDGNVTFSYAELNYD